jgi:hypothetical protein
LGVAASRDEEKTAQTRGDKIIFVIFIITGPYYAVEKEVDFSA